MSLERRQPLKRTGRLRQRSSKRTAKLEDPERLEAREAVWRRSGGRCEVKARGCSHTASGQHHRQLERHGGPDTPENLVAVCNECHTASPEAIHRNVARSIEQGLIVPSWEPAPTACWRRPGEQY